MQRPTCTNLRIRSTRDAHKIFYAIKRGILHLVTRRLDADERQALASGCIYAWEERGPNAEVTGLGIERFTEGRRWSPSRVRDEFLFYYEKWSPPASEAHSTHSSNLDKEAPGDWEPLVKQTYSVFVETDKGKRKWHLTSYFTQSTVDRLATVDDLPGVGDVEVPGSLFTSTRVVKARRGDEGGRPSDVLRSNGSTLNRTYAPFPASSVHLYNPVDLSPRSGHPYDDRGRYYEPSSSTSTEPPFSRSLSYDNNSRPSQAHTNDNLSLTPSYYGVPPTLETSYHPWYRATPELPSAWYAVPSHHDQEAHSPYSSRNPQSHNPAPISSYPPTSGADYSRTLRPYHQSLEHDRPYLLHRSSSYSESVRTLTKPELPSSIDSAKPRRSSSSERSNAEPRGNGAASLVPLRTLLRSHPYRRDPVDDRALRKLDPRPSTS